MDEAITETSETASSSEENDLPEQSLQKYSDDWDESQILEELQRNALIIILRKVSRIVKC